MNEIVIRLCLKRPLSFQLDPFRNLIITKNAIINAKHLMKLFTVTVYSNIPRAFPLLGAGVHADNTSCVMPAHYQDSLPLREKSHTLLANATTLAKATNSKVGNRLAEYIVKEQTEQGASNLHSPFRMLSYSPLYH